MRTTDTCLAAVLGIALAAAGCTGSPAEEARAGDFRVSARLVPDPPTTGDNRLVLTLRDADGRPVDGAKLDFRATMAAMGTMPEMRHGGEVVARGGGVYQVTYPLTMQGDWSVQMRIEAPGHPPAELRFRVAPPRKGLVFTPAVADAADAGAVPMLEVSPARQQRIGVTWGRVERRALSLSLRLPARVEVDETQVADVTLRYPAFVERLHVAQTGEAVKKGQPLLTVYSPDLLAAEQDLLVARSAGDRSLIAAAEERLRLWGITPEQMRKLVERGQAEPRVTLRAPLGGVVLMKNVVEGTRVETGAALYRIGNLGRVWVQADVFEADAARVAVGQAAAMTVPAFPGVTWRGKVRFLSPTVDERSRTVRARLEFENGEGALRPGMFADAVVEVPLGERLSVPDGAVLRTGEHAYVFVRRGPLHIQPVAVEPGVQAGGFTELRAGVAPDEEVALGAAFLLSSEAQLRDALPRWSTP